MKTGDNSYSQLSGLEVASYEEKLPASPPGELPPQPINWLLIGGIIGGVIVVGLSIFFLVRKRAH